MPRALRATRDADAQETEPARDEVRRPPLGIAIVRVAEVDDRITRRQVRRDRGDLPVAEAVDLEVGQGVIRLAVLRLRGQCGAVEGEVLLELRDTPSGDLG